MRGDLAHCLLVLDEQDRLGALGAAGRGDRVVADGGLLGGGQQRRKVVPTPGSE